MTGGEHRTDKDNSVYRIVFKEAKIFHFLCRGVVGPGEKHLIASLGENTFNACCDPADGFGIDLWNDHTHQACFFGAKHTCLGGWLVAGLLDHLTDLFFFLFTDVAAVQISGYSCAGDSGELCDFFDCHNIKISFLYNKYKKEISGCQTEKFIVIRIKCEQLRMPEELRSVYVQGNIQRFPRI